MIRPPAEWNPLPVKCLDTESLVDGSLFWGRPLGHSWLSVCIGPRKMIHRFPYGKVPWGLRALFSGRRTEMKTEKHKPRVS